MKSFHLSGPKFDIVVGDVLHGRIFEFSIRSEICRGRIRKCEDWSQEGQFCEGRPPLPMPNGTNQSLTLF